MTFLKRKSEREQNKNSDFRTYSLGVLDPLFRTLALGELQQWRGGDFAESPCVGDNH